MWFQLVSKDICMNFNVIVIVMLKLFALRKKKIVCIICAETIFLWLSIFCGDDFFLSLIRL